MIKCFGEGKKEMSLCNKIYNEIEWPEEFMETVLLTVPKKNNAKKCKEFRTINLISHTAKIILGTLNRHLLSKIEEELEEEQFGFGKGKGTRHAIRLVRKIGERYIEKYRDVYAVIVDLQNAFARMEWKKLLGILKKKLVWIGRRGDSGVIFTANSELKSG